MAQSFVSVWQHLQESLGLSPSLRLCCEDPSLLLLKEEDTHTHTHAPFTVSIKTMCQKHSMGTYLCLEVNIGLMLPCGHLETETCYVNSQGTCSDCKQEGESIQRRSLSEALGMAAQEAGLRLWRRHQGPDSVRLCSHPALPPRPRGGLARRRLCCRLWTPEPSQSSFLPGPQASHSIFLIRAV